MGKKGEWAKRRGREREVFLSEKYHGRHTAVLISPKVLRSRQFGQVDLCFMRGGRVVVVEVKGYGKVGGFQMGRLAHACEWLGRLFRREVFFFVAHRKKEFLP
ncbi:MAG: hypothetical protein OXB88_00270 [Bacteriovoracales bacterium]|nr:hypothetical protein [Bacteriovoracales bacterium]